MDAQEIIDYIANSEKKTPVKLYVNTTGPVDFGSAKVFGGPRQRAPTVARPPSTAPMSIMVPGPTTAPMLMTAPIMMTAPWPISTFSREGVHIGKNAVVAAGAVVIEDVPENAVVAPEFRRSFSMTRSAIFSRLDSRMGPSSAQSPKEELEFTHRAASRQIFVNGALHMARLGPSGRGRWCRRAGACRSGGHPVP